MLYEAEAGNLTLVAGGDTMITRQLSVFREPAFLSLVELFRSADVGYANLEMLMHDFEHSPGISGGTFTGSDPANLKELQWVGINLVSTANNHSYDYGSDGVLTNIAHLKSAAIVFAGTGRNLSEARAPGYLDTPAGRVALISASSTFNAAGRAADQRPDMKGRPGLNPLQHSVTYTVDRPAFDALRRISRALGFEASNATQRKFRPSGAVMEDNDTQLGFLGRKFVLGKELNTSTKPHRRDMEGNLKWVRDARRMADWVFVSFHCHESGETTDEPPQFLKTFARACIDAGADGFLGHGPHVTRGIEIHKGKPIFYSLGNLVFQNDTVRWQPRAQLRDDGLGSGSDSGRLLRPTQRTGQQGLSLRPGVLAERRRELRVQVWRPGQDHASPYRHGTRQAALAARPPHAGSRRGHARRAGQGEEAFQATRS